MDRLATKRTC